LKLFINPRADRSFSLIIVWFRGGTQMSQIAQENTLFEIDRELDLLLDEIQEESDATDGGAVRPDLILRFQQFCDAHNEKVDRIGRFLTAMEWRSQYCKAEASRLYDRARAAGNKADRTKSMVLFYLSSRDLRKVEGSEFTLRSQKNSQDSVRIIDASLIPFSLRDVEARIPGQLWESIVALLPQETATALSRCVHQTKPNNDAIKLAVGHRECVPGVEVCRDFHLRVA